MTAPAAVELVITVHDRPRPQGSKRHVGHGRMIESSKELPVWREAVKQAALGTMSEPYDCPLWVSLVFTLPKPSSAPVRRRTWPMRTPDLSKLVRGTEDALTAAAVWKDDARVVELVAAKRYPGEGVDALPHPGCIIRIRPIEESTP